MSRNKSIQIIKKFKKSSNHQNFLIFHKMHCAEYKFSLQSILKKSTEWNPFSCTFHLLLQFVADFIFNFVKSHICFYCFLSSSYILMLFVLSFFPIHSFTLFFYTKELSNNKVKRWSMDGMCMEYVAIKKNKIYCDLMKLQRNERIGRELFFMNHHNFLYVFKLKTIFLCSLMLLLL